MKEDFWLEFLGRTPISWRQAMKTKIFLSIPFISRAKKTFLRVLKWDEILRKSSLEL